MNSLSGVQRLRQLRALNIANTHLVTDSILLLRRVTLLTSLDLRNTLQVDGDLALEYLNPEGQFYAPKLATALWKCVVHVNPV